MATLSNGDKATTTLANTDTATYQSNIWDEDNLPWAEDYLPWQDEELIETDSALTDLTNDNKL